MLYFSKYWTGHCPERSRTCVFVVFAFFSRVPVINLLLTKLARDRTGRISALGLFCTDLAALGPYCQDLGLIFSQCGPRAWLIRYIYITTAKGPRIEFSGTPDERYLATITALCQRSIHFCHIRQKYLANKINYSKSLKTKPKVKRDTEKVLLARMVFSCILPQLHPHLVPRKNTARYEGDLAHFFQCRGSLGRFVRRVLSWGSFARHV